jgi:phosphatidylglycerol:prolipoprotein diacylglycerol transferase
VGGRLGYVFFYDPLYFLNNPLKIVAVWEGGMASHGGFIGVAVALLYALRHQSWKDILKIADTISIPIILGLGIGRIGNFINQELYGTVTNLPWGIAVPDAAGLRHPVQLYEFGTSVLIAILLYWHLRRADATPGRTFALFLLLYGIVRIFLEWVRVHAYLPLLVGSIPLYREQLLTLPILLAGMILLLWKKRSQEDLPE